MKLTQIFPTKHSRIWLIVSTIFVILFMLITILSLTMFYDVASNVLGKERRIVAGGSDQAYTTEMSSKEEARKNGEYVNELINEEGIVLLKNNQDTLPLASGSKISVFGKNSVNIVYGGSGSAAGSGEFTKSLFESLEAVGFEYNPTLKSFYESDDSGSGRPGSPKMENDGSISLSTGETPWSSYGNDIISSFDEYDDAALIVISRIGGEGWDLPRTMLDNEGQLVSGARNADDHYLQLDANETEMIHEVADAFDKVIIVINSSASLELGFLDNPGHYAYETNIDAALWIGAPGDTGIMALGRVLDGTVNPSGRTVDTLARDFKADPTWQNFGDNLETNGQMYTDVQDKNSSYLYAFVDYEEGIYVGYRYYETRGFTDGEQWYEDSVVYPFGYGLSYTTFNQTIKNKSSLDGDNFDENSLISVTVEVENTGDVAGKDAVMIFVTTPYIDGEIEKSHVVLVGFAKTPLIEAGEAVEVEVEIDPYSFASYDYNDANDNQFSGYELDNGNYVFRLGENSHTFYDEFTMTLSTGITYDVDPVTGYQVENRFDDADDELSTVLSRTDWVNTFPQTRTETEKVLSAITNQIINSTDSKNPLTYSDFPILGETNEVRFKDLVG